MSDEVVPTRQRFSAVAPERPRVRVVDGKLQDVRKAWELGLHVVLAQLPDEYGGAHLPTLARQLEMADG